jgi:hypothetical protein
VAVAPAWEFNQLLKAVSSVPPIISHCAEEGDGSFVKTGAVLSKRVYVPVSVRALPHASVAVN